MYHHLANQTIVINSNVIVNLLISIQSHVHILCLRTTFQYRTCPLFESAIMPSGVSSGKDKTNDKGRIMSEAADVFLPTTGVCDACRWTPVTAADSSSSAAIRCRNCTDRF